MAMEADLPAVLRLPRVESPSEEFILLNVSSAGRHSLDLKLIGTDGESVFSVSVKHNQTSSLRAKKFSGGQEQLEKILSATLLAAGRDEDTRDIEAVARVKGNSMTIYIQKSIEGITQRFAEITLPESDAEDEVQLFDWCGLAINSKNKSTSELEELRKSLQEKEQETKKLKDELEDLTKLKNAHENSLIEKFSLLLNEKKLKIRDQQRLLAGATVDPARLEAIEQSRSNARSRSPGPSRIGKRKVGNVVKDDNDTDDGFEKMEVDEPDDSDVDDRRTPDPDSTADEASDDDEPAPPPTKSSNAVKNTNTRATRSATTGEASALPPKRELPFAAKKAAPPAKPADGSETESDEDDEL